MKRSRVVIGLTATALVLPLGTMATTAGAAVMPSGSVVVAEDPPTETPPEDMGGGGDSAPDTTPNVGLGPVISGDGSTIAFESVAPLTADDLNSVQSTCKPEVGRRLSGVVPTSDIYAYDMDTKQLRRVTKANTTGLDTDPATGQLVVPSEATGFKIDGHTGECVPATNGADPALSTDGTSFAFVSGGNLVGRVVEDEEGEVVPTAETGGTTDGTAIEPNIYKNAGPDTTTWVSDDGGSAGRELPAISGDGRYVVLVGRSKASAGVYVKDTESTDKAVRVATGFLFNPDISVDGNTVAWAKYGSGDQGGQQIYVLQKTKGQSWADVAGTEPELVSLSDAGVPADGVTDFPSLNEDGSLVAFQSMDKTLDADAIAGKAGGGPNKAYVRDRKAGTTEMVSLVDGEDGAPDTIINGQGIKPVITPDGTFVAFASDASALQGLVEEESVAAAAEEEETTTYQQVYVRDLSTDTTLPVSLALDETDPSDGLSFGGAASSTSYGPSISDDGRYVVFESDAANLVEGDTNEDTDAFVRDMETGVTTRISLDENGDQPDLDPDAGPPVSKASGKSLTNRSPLTVKYTADDPVYPSLGVTAVRLYVKRPGETGFTLRQVDKGTGMDGKFSVRTGGKNGVFAFMTQAVDGQGNVEDLPGVGDARTRLDTVAPTIKGLKVPGSFDLSSDRKMSITTRVPQSAKRTVVIKHDGIVIKSYRTRMTAAGLLTQVWYGRNDAGVRVHGGRYTAVLRATDLAGNTSRKAVAFTVTR